MSPARVLTVVSDLGLGGTQRAAENMAVGYHRRGFDSAVLAFGGGGPRAARLTDAGVPTIVGGGAAATEEAVAAAIAWRPDLVHVHRAGWMDAASGDVLRRLRSAAPAPVIETSVFGRPDYSDVGDIIDLHAHISLWSAWRWRSLGRWRRGRSAACLLPYSCDTAAFDASLVPDRSAVRDSLGIPADAFVVGRLGQRSEPKWSPHTVAAFELVARREPDAWLVLVGAPPSVVAQVAALPPAVATRVRCLPVTAHERSLVDVYVALDVFLHSSTIGESFGMVLAESLACRTPVVTLATPMADNGQLEVVGDGVGGHVCWSTEELADAVLSLGRDEGRRRAMGEAGRRRVEDLFDVQVLDARLATIAEAVLSGDRGGIDERVRVALGDDLERRLLGGDPQERVAADALVEDTMATRPARQRAMVRLRHHPAAYLSAHPAAAGAALRTARRPRARASEAGTGSQPGEPGHGSLGVSGVGGEPGEGRRADALEPAERQRPDRPGVTPLR